MISVIIKKVKTMLGVGPIDSPPFTDKYVTVFSHPRSGTHFLEAFLAENFYKNEDLYIPNVTWGHWSNRKLREDGNKYGKLFGSHIFPTKALHKIDYPICYIYRDGRAVAFSIWKTNNFINPKHKDMAFSDFLRQKIDWIGSPAFKCKEKMLISEHWMKHVAGWFKLAEINPNIMIIRYEDIVNEPYKVYRDIHARFFVKSHPLLGEEDIDPITRPVGLLPNKAKKDSWKAAFTEEDERFFWSTVDELPFHLPKG